MTRKSELLSARDALKMRCNNYFTNLYDCEAFKEFRDFAESDLINVKLEIQRNNKLKPQYQIPSEQLENRKNTLDLYLKEKDNLQLVIKCLDNNYTPDEYMVITYGSLKITSKLSLLKAVNNLLDCFALIDNNVEISTEVAKQQINNFHQVFLKEKECFKFDTEGQKFLEAIGHIFASIFTGGIYAIAQVSYSLYKKNSLMFWKSEPELIQYELDNALKEANLQL